MNAPGPNAKARTLRGFFADHLPRVRGSSPHTVLSYRDSLVLFLRFVADRRTRSVSQLDLDDLGPSQVLDFLQHLESARHNLVATRNVRLAAIHAFFRYCATEEPARVEHCPTRTRRAVQAKPLASDRVFRLPRNRSGPGQCRSDDGRWASRLRAARYHVQHGRSGAGNRHAVRARPATGGASPGPALRQGSQGAAVPLVAANR